MTVIAVRKYLKKIILSCDSQTSWGDSKLTDSKTQLYSNCSKIWENENVVVGSAGTVKGATFFKIFTKSRKPSQSDSEGIIDYIVDFVEWAKKKQSDFILENHFIIIFDKKVYQCVGYDVQEVPEYNAIGSGMFLALGAMYKGSDPIEAVEVAKQFDLYCNGKTDTIEVELKDK